MSKKKIDNIPFGPYITVLVGATVNGKANYATVGAYGVVSQKPDLYMSLKNSHYTTQGVKDNGFFSVNIPPSHLVKKVDYCGTYSGTQIDKSKMFTSFYDKKGNAPMIEECAINYLCKVIKTIPIFDFTMFIGEIVTTYGNDECLENGRPNPLKVSPIVLMNTGYFNLDKKICSIFESYNQVK